MTTQVTRRSNVSYLPRMFRRKRVHVLPNGKEEIIALDIVHDALLPLSSDAQTRVLEYVVKILNERTRALNEYEYED